MRNLITVAATVLMLAAGFSSAGVATSATAKAAPHYDCTKKGNANKAACKATAATTPAETPTAAAPAAPVKKPSLVSKLMHPAAKPATPASTPTPAAPAAPAAAMSAATPAGSHPVCKKGKPCGNSCIAMTKTCHKT